mgnify:CR=1 FL=1
MLSTDANTGENSDSLEISVKETSYLLSAENPPILIDCREQHEFDFCRIKGGVLVPLSSFAGKVEALFHHAEQHAIIYCHHGVRSLYAVQYLREQGYKNTLSMQGGIDAWSISTDDSVARY